MDTNTAASRDGGAFSNDLTADAHSDLGGAALNHAVELSPTRSPGAWSHKGDSPSLGRVLVVDDEHALRRVLRRVLTHAGYEVETVGGATAALELLSQREFDAVVSDISMPDGDGTELLRLTHERDPYLPVILVTGVPTVETATKAVKHHAFRYLFKPYPPAEIVQVVSEAVANRRASEARRLADQRAAAEAEIARLAHDSLAADFNAALDTLWMAFQPIVHRDGTLYGYEALLRTRSTRFPNPPSLLEAAEKLGRSAELASLVRARTAKPFETAPEGALLFVNLQPDDLFNPELTAEGAPLVSIAHRVVLEVTERSALEGRRGLQERVCALRAAGFRLAVDDLGAGYAGLSSFAAVRPEVAKVDMALVRGIDTDPVKRRLVRALAELCADTGALLVAEGVETRGEHAALHALGVDLFQGYLIGRPSPPFIAPSL